MGARTRPHPNPSPPMERGIVRGLATPSLLVVLNPTVLVVAVNPRLKHGGYTQLLRLKIEYSPVLQRRVQKTVGL
jgi:hypothetical protein